MITPTARWSDTLLQIVGSTPDAMVWSWQLSKFKETVSTATRIAPDRSRASDRHAGAATGPSQAPATKGGNASLAAPREHGAYALLLIPLLTAFISHGMTVVGVAVFVAAVAGFLSHEPVLVRLGMRGRRARTETQHSSVQALVLLGLCIGSGGFAFVVGSASTRTALLLCLALAVVSFAIAFRGQHRSKFGQAFGVIGLTAPVVPTLTAADLTLSRAILIWCVWVLGYTATTTAVHAVIAKQKRQPRKVHTAIILCMAVVATGLVVLRGEALGLGPLPMIAASCYLLIAPPPAKQLRQVGWALVASTLASAVVFAAV